MVSIRRISGIRVHRGLPKIKNATTTEQLRKIVNNAGEDAEKLRGYAQGMQYRAEIFPTRRNIKMTRTAENEASKAEVQAVQTVEESLQRQAALDNIEKRKILGRKISASRTPEQLEKERINGEIAKHNSQKRIARRNAMKQQNQHKVDKAANRSYWKEAL